MRRGAPRRPLPATAKSGVTDTCSFRLDVAGADHFRPFFRFVGNQLGKGGRRQPKRRVTEFGDPPYDLRIVERATERRAERVDDRGRSTAGRGKSDIDAGFE